MTSLNGLGCHDRVGLPPSSVPSFGVVEGLHIFNPGPCARVAFMRRVLPGRGGPCRGQAGQCVQHELQFSFKGSSV